MKLFTLQNSQFLHTGLYASKPLNSVMSPKMQGSEDRLTKRSQKMKVLVVGATGGSGRAAVEQLLAKGYEVTAFARQADRIQTRSERLHFINGSVMNQQDVERAVRGQDAVIVTLGISESPVRVRVFGPSHTPINVRSAGTQNVISAMQKEGVRKLVVQSSYGVGETRNKLGLVDKLFFKLLLKPQIADTEVQETAVRESGLDWMLIQPVHLTNKASKALPTVSTKGETGKMKVSRSSVGRFLAEAVQNPAYVHKSVSLSGS